jgi:hypothetical protein
MAKKAHLHFCYIPSDDVVAREIEGELILVPLVSGIGDLDDELFTVNEHGRAIWSLLSREKTLQEIAGELGQEYRAAPGEIEQDVVGFVEELLRRKLLVECPPALSPSL